MSKSKTPLFIILSLIICLLCSTDVIGQEEYISHPKHRLAGMIGHTHVPLGFNTAGERDFLVVPTWGLSYDFRLAKHWSLGLHSEIETATYVVEKSESAEIERERPFKIVLATTYNPWKSLVFEGGFGREIETHESFWIYRIGAGYEIEIGHEWDLVPALFFDIKEDVYTSWTFGLQVGKIF
jgi:hypothetical protein